MTDLEAFIDYYVGLDRPGYAVLVTGPWGTGKTFQVKQALTSEKYHYVSLNGVSTAQDVHNAVLAAVLPAQKGVEKLTNWAGKVGKALGGPARLATMAPELANTALRRWVKIDSAIVFDDLERCEIPIKERLGLINEYVEHRQCRVIVIAHDAKIVNEIKDLKEKLIGRTFEVDPKTDQAFTAFLNEVGNAKARKFIQVCRPTLIEIFAQSGVQSLRTLRHSILDLARLHDALHPDHLQCDPLMSEFIPFIFAADIEYREGNLAPSDFNERHNALLAFNLKNASKTTSQSESPVQPPILTRNEQYADVDLMSSVLPDNVLIELIVKGRYRPEPLKAALDKHPLFASYDDLPAWKIVWYFGQVPDDVVEEAAVRMEQQFANREVTVPGEILHICCLRIMMAEEDILEQSVECVIEENIQYISDMLERDELPPRPTNWDWEHDFFMQHDNLGFWGDRDGNPSIQKIKEYLSSCMNQALENSFESEAPGLLKLMVSDPTEFRRDISYNSDHDSRFAAVPVLKVISPEEFVDAWLDSDERNWLPISRALERRYEAATSDGGLSKEWAWLDEVFQLLRKRAVAAKGFRRMRINWAVPEGLEMRVKAELAKVELPT